MLLNNQWITEEIKEEIKKYLETNGNQKKTGVALFISFKIDFNPKTVTRDRESYYIIIKVSVHQDDITTVNIYTLIGVKYIISP